ncbi:unnamed protein product [Sphagnum jensenii]|uniref:Uncharacterized protein n=1 Tax=Sphagnum jensenii TaxID=128206 RepID=A0ABP1BXU1_9BRYO
MARSTNSLFCLPLNPTVTFLPIRHFFVCAGDYAFKSPVGRSNVAVRSSEIAATLLTFPLTSVAALRSLIVAAVNKEKALILQFAWSFPRILPVVRAGPWHPPGHILQPFSTEGIHTMDSISCLEPQDLLQLHTLASLLSLLDLCSD